MTSETTYHVVCRDCETELLAPSRRVAELVVDDHEAAADHRVAFARVD